MNKLAAKIKNINIKSALRIGTILIVLVLIVLISFGFGLDPKKIVLEDWISKTTIMITISIYSILIGESIGNDKQKSNPNGLYQTNLKKHNQIVERVKSINSYFGDFLIWYKEIETKNKKITLLMNNNILCAKEIVNNLPIEDIDKLINQPIKINDDCIITKKNNEQVKIIKSILTQTKVKSPLASYYLNPLENCEVISDLELGFRLDRDKKLNKGVQRSFKIITSVIISMIWAMITVKDFTNNQVYEATFDLISRIATLLTCLFSGYCISVIDVKIDANKIENKINIIEKFKIAYDTKEFVPLNYKDLAREEYEKYEQQVTKEDN